MAAQSGPFTPCVHRVRRMCAALQRVAAHKMRHVATQFTTENAAQRVSPQHIMLRRRAVLQRSWLERSTGICNAVMGAASRRRRDVQQRSALVVGEAAIEHLLDDRLEPRVDRLPRKSPALTAFG